MATSLPTHQRANARAAGGPPSLGVGGYDLTARQEIGPRMSRRGAINRLTIRVSQAILSGARASRLWLESSGRDPAAWRPPATWPDDSVSWSA